MDDEKFFAWLDGELPPEEARRVAEEVASSPELSARAEQHRGLAAGLRGAFAPVLETPSQPPRFASMATSISHLAAARRRAPIRPRIPQWAALAASLALGLVVGSQFPGPAADRSPVTMQGGRLVASAGLEQSLDTLLAGSSNEATRIGLTFRGRAGEICRSFSGPSASGLACRSGDGWELRGLFPAGEGASSDYRMAAGQHPQLAALIDESIAGEPFDAEQEKAALERGWR